MIIKTSPVTYAGKVTQKVTVVSLPAEWKHLKMSMKSISCWQCYIIMQYINAFIYTYIYIYIFYYRYLSVCQMLCVNSYYTFIGLLIEQMVRVDVKDSGLHKLIWEEMKMVFFGAFSSFFSFFLNRTDVVHAFEASMKSKVLHQWQFLCNYFRRSRKAI